MLTVAKFKFSPAQTAALKPTGKPYDISDPAVPNLLPRVGPKGTKRWLFRFHWKNKQTRLAIGNFPKIGLAQAREGAIARQNRSTAGLIQTDRTQCFILPVERR
jgi:hypothetical protein